MPNGSPVPRFFTTKELADFLRTTPKGVYHLVARRPAPAAAPPRPEAPLRPRRGASLALGEPCAVAYPGVGDELQDRGVPGPAWITRTAATGTRVAAGSAFAFTTAGSRTTGCTCPTANASSASGSGSRTSGRGPSSRRDTWATQREVYFLQQYLDEGRRKSRMKVRDLAAKWLAERETVRGTRASTRTGSGFEDHILPVLGNITLMDVRPRHSADLVNKLKMTPSAPGRQPRLADDPRHLLPDEAALQPRGPAGARSRATRSSSAGASCRRRLTRTRAGGRAPSSPRRRSRRSSRATRSRSTVGSSTPSRS